MRHWFIWMMKMNKFKRFKTVSQKKMMRSFEFNQPRYTIYLWPTRQFNENLRCQILMSRQNLIRHSLRYNSSFIFLYRVMLTLSKLRGPLQMRRKKKYLMPSTIKTSHNWNPSSLLYPHLRQSVFHKYLQMMMMASTYCIFVWRVVGKIPSIIWITYSVSIRKNTGNCDLGGNNYKNGLRSSDNQKRQYRRL